MYTKHFLMMLSGFIFMALIGLGFLAYFNNMNHQPVLSDKSLQNPALSSSTSSIKTQ